MPKPTVIWRARRWWPSRSRRPANTAEELDLKIDQYLRGGSQVVWVAYPKRKAIVRYALVAGRIHAAEHRAGEALSEDIVSPPCGFDPAEFF
jgi:hypothetical protein